MAINMPDNLPAWGMAVHGISLGQSGVLPPAPGGDIATEANDPITTEAGDNLITES